MIGREKNPGESEVARLIEQSIAEDKRRDDMRQRQQEAARQVCVLYVPYLRLLYDSYGVSYKSSFVYRHVHCTYNPYLHNFQIVGWQIHEQYQS